MIKQRNGNSFKENNGWFVKDKIESPFNRSNPYRVKAQFYSEGKKRSMNNNMNNGTHMRKSSQQTNPESLKYRRNYKQSPPTTATMKMFDNRQLLLKDNYIEIKNNMLARSLNNMQEELQQQQYRLRLKQYVADKFCPSDMYLEIVKDKFAFFNNHNSQFQNVMKMSNLGISRLVAANSGSKNKQATYSTVSYKDRVNPFYRKNLLSAHKDNQVLYDSCKSTYKGEYFPDAMSASHVSAYQYNTIPQMPSISHYQHMNSNVYQIIIPPPSDPKHYSKQHKMSIYSDQQGSRVSNNGLESYNGGLIPSLKELDASFGVDYNMKQKNHIKPFIDAVISQRLQDPLKIQSTAPKTIKIQGKTFYFNHVNR